jgi:LmbE family N-acetylglucosaminyl deacetylase
MLKFEFATPKDSPLKILCLGAHSDDIEIGCGGTLLRLLDDYHDVNVHWIVFSADGDREEEARNGALAFLEKAGLKKVVIRNYRDGFFPYIGGEGKGFFETLKNEVQPNLIFTHYRYDLHQDHRLISELTWSTYRDHLILEYEIPKYDGDIGNPNLYVPLSENVCQSKIDKILRFFKSQKSRGWFSNEVFRSLLTLRGIESNAGQGYAEAFYCRKGVV